MKDEGRMKKEERGILYLILPSAFILLPY